MNYLSVCSGIEAATVAWHPLGWRPVAFSQFDPDHDYKRRPDFPSRVLAHHYPNVPNLGDMTKFKEWPDATCNVLVGGTPCQSFSVAGLRKGMADPRGNLALIYLAVADRYRPEWIVWENVPGVLSSNGGRDFGAFLGGLVQLGYGFAYRVLDAQYVRVDGFARAVPQRRRRVFVVGYLGDWRRAAAVLFERESLHWYSAPRREAGEGVAGAISASAGRRGSVSEGERGGLIAGTINASGKAAGSATQQDAESGLLVAHALRADGFDASEDGTGRGTPSVPIAFDSKASGRNGFGAGPISPTLRSMNHSGSHQNGGGQVAVAFAENSRAELRLCGGDGSVASQLTTGGGKPGQGQPCIAQTWAVRRLTPLECERLQGFPDGYTDIPGAADGPRYKALGNSMAVNVMRWIGRRIQMVDDLARELAA